MYSGMVEYENSYGTENLNERSGDGVMSVTANVFQTYAAHIVDEIQNCGCRFVTLGRIMLYSAYCIFINYPWDEEGN